MLSRTACVTGLLAVASVVSANSDNVITCGNSDPTPEHKAASDALIKAARENMSLFGGSRNMTMVKTYFHIMHLDETEEGGYISTETVQKQVEVMNDSFGPHGFNFDLQDTLYYDNEEWALETSRDVWDTTIRPATRQGGYDTLNLWWNPALQAGLGGYCTFPVENPSESEISSDGCHIIAPVIVGGSNTNYDLGFIAVHEIGHWFDLYHTFQGAGCEEPGDFVDDTPAQDGASQGGCPVGKDSCPDHEGLDPIHNHMDYTNDYCKEEFTAGQQERMRASFDGWRSSA